MIKIINEINQDTLREISKCLTVGGVICFPTDTLYAISADATNHLAVDKIFNIKNRDYGKPLPVLIHNIKQADDFAYLNNKAEKIAHKFFPGPITIITRLKSKHNLASNINIMHSNIGFRVPNHATALAILKHYNKPLIGTSANLSQGSDSMNIKDIVNNFINKVDIIVDVGAPHIFKGSTIVNTQTENIEIIRVGAISEQEIKHHL